MSDRSETFGQAINLAVEQGLRHIYTCLPARVVKWDSSKCRADCKILVKDVTTDEEGERQVNSWPVIPGCIVQFLGAGDMRLTLPIRAGSTDGTIGTLFFAHRSLDKWATGDGKEVDPEDDHSNGLQDAIFIPGLRTFGSTWASVPEDEMSIGDDTDGNGRIHFATGEIKLGDGASAGVARNGDKTKTTIAVTMGTGPLSAAIASITITDPTTGLPNVLTTGNLSGDAAGEIIEGSEHVKAVD